MACPLTISVFWWPTMNRWRESCSGSTSPPVTVSRSCANAWTPDALAAGLHDEVVDAAVLDIRMPGRDVFDVLSEAARDATSAALIFATAYDRYALRAFEVNAVDYLLKPFTGERSKPRSRGCASGAGRD